MSPSSAVVKVGISLTGIRHEIDIRLFSGCESGCGAEAKNGGKAQEHRQKQRQAPFAGRSKHSKNSFQIGKSAPNVDALSALYFVLWSCIADIDIPRAFCPRLCPYPHSRDVRIPTVFVQQPAQIPFQISTGAAGDGGIVPTAYCLTVQLQADAFGISLGKIHPISHIECRLRCRFCGHSCRRLGSILDRRLRFWLDR